ncbi:MAG: hypothetical protein CMF99_05405 [Candidatus Marinimicrobia bacterium]|nr:hypothetical protein [Candidatus Neomarinimicrobiota bacterium]|tara:strand:+ start:8904 stop:9578 length:675 start_codon:yes stop_codon:yes gene_type:complete
MKNILYIIVLSKFIWSQEMSSMKALEAIFQTSAIVDYFDGMFTHLGIIVEETGEKFTIHHNGESIKFIKGLNKKNVDFIVPLGIQNIENMVSHAKSGTISNQESWQILSVLFTPLTKETLKSPVLSVNWRRKIAGVEDLTHVLLISPNGKEASKHTLIYVKNQWLVLGGLHGNPRRTYRMNPNQAILYQKKIFAAMQKDSFIGWFQFSSWYKKWRKSCSEKHKV